jgi:hypothetical protein
MTDKIPPSWFDHQNQQTDDADAKRRANLLNELPDLMKRQAERRRADKFEPYLLVRSVLGDRGDRPINVPFWESPDIWTAHGDPSTTPEVPVSHGGSVVMGVANTVYAHVWNLGFAPLTGVRVDFYWFNPSLAIDGAHAHLIGTARCELSGRAMPGSHKLVKCPKPWVPVMENGGHECLTVRLSGIGDPIGGNEWSPWLNRHVAQRNVSVVSAGVSATKLFSALNATRVSGAHLQLIQVGAKEGALAVRMVAPQLRIAPQMSTHLLGELTAQDEITLVSSAVVPAGMFESVHVLAHGIERSTPTLHRHGDVAVVDPARVLRDIHPSERATTTTPHLADLFGAVGQLHDGGELLGAPSRGEAYMLRMATYEGQQLIGGYTLIVGSEET